MKYKALICDIDGTLMVNKKDGMPTPGVSRAVSLAAKVVHVGVATSRTYHLASPIMQCLDLYGPSIIHGGAEIINAHDGSIFVEYAMKKSDIKRVYAIAKELHHPLLVDEENNTLYANDAYEFDRPILGSVIIGLSNPEAEIVVSKLKSIPSVAIHTIPSWTSGKVDVSIGSAQATKQHAVIEVARLLGISTKEIVAVGDGNNDFPLLMAAGLKVAMGNAVPDLKTIADYVAPSVEEDGIIDVINKFILS